MQNNITYEDKLEIDSLVKEISAYSDNFHKKYIFHANISETINQLLENLKDYKFNNALICYNKINKYLINIPKSESYSNSDVWYQKAMDNEIKDLSNIIERTKLLCDDLIEKGLDSFQEEDVELSEKDKLKIQKQKIDKRLKEIQEENTPYLNFSIGLSLVITAIVFMCIPTFFNTVALYHVCGSMLGLGVLLLINEIKIRQSIGWSNYSDKITSKRAFVFLLQAFVYMIPLSVLFFFFSENIIIKILFFVQVWFCGILMINGIALLIITNITKNKEKKFNIWNFILGVITIVAFVLQLLQIFKVL